jgi:hypothetical protein
MQCLCVSGAGIKQFIPETNFLKTPFCVTRDILKVLNIVYVYTETPVLNDRLWRGWWITEDQSPVMSV